MHRVLLDSKENAEYRAVEERKQLLSKLKAHYSAPESTSAGEDQAEREGSLTAEGEDGGCLQENPLVLSKEEILQQLRVDYNDLVTKPPLEIEEVKESLSTELEIFSSIETSVLSDGFMSGDFASVGYEGPVAPPTTLHG